MATPDTISAVSTEYYRVPLPEPLCDARHGEHTHFELIVAKIRSTDGGLGVGYRVKVARSVRMGTDLLVESVLSGALVEGVEFAAVGRAGVSSGFMDDLGGSRSLFAPLDRRLGGP